MKKLWPIAPLALLAAVVFTTAATRGQAPSRPSSPRNPSGSDYRGNSPAPGRSLPQNPGQYQREPRSNRQLRRVPQQYAQQRPYDQRPQYNGAPQYRRAPQYRLAPQNNSPSTYARPGGWSGRSGGGPAPWTLASRSFYYIEQQAPRKLRQHDIVTIIVEEKFSVTSEGEVDRRKNGLYDAVIADWLRLAPGPSLKPDPQTDGDPTVSGSVQQTYRSEASVENTERMQFKIAATIADIRPNGNLVLEAHRTVHYNREVWIATLTGIVRPDDINPDNTVLTEDIAELNIDKRQRGHVRDGTRRGWATRLIDALNPF